MSVKSYREHSKDNWGRDTAELDLDHIKVGSIQRIADACEAMAKNHTQLLNELAWYKGECERQRKSIKHLEGSRAAYKAHLTRMKKKFSNSTQP